ncbi:MAG: citrate (Si)-synthase, partial [Alphaproteobacteria bacterium]
MSQAQTKRTAPKAARNSVTITDNRTGKTFELPILDGTQGPAVIDVRKLYAEAGYFTYDPGFTST